MQEKSKSQQEGKEVDSIDIEENNDPVAYAEFRSSKGREEIPQDTFTVSTISEAFEIRKSIGI